MTSGVDIEPDDALDGFAGLFREYVGDSAAEALALQLFGGVSHRDEGRYSRGRIHLALCCEPGAEIESMLHRVKEVVPGYDWYSSGGLPESDVTVRFDTETGEIVPGVVLDDETSVLAIDGATDFFTTGSDAASAMGADVHRVCMSGETAEFEPRAGLLLVDRPVYGTWDEYESVHDQLPFDSGILGRVDATVRDIDRPERERIGADIESVDADDAGAYLQTAWGLTPELNEEAREMIEEFVGESVEGSDSHHQWPPARIADSTRRFAEAAARSRLNEVVGTNEARVAIGVVGRSLQDVGHEFDVGQFDAVKEESSTGCRQAIEEVFADFGEEYDEGVPTEKFIEESSKSEKEVRDELEKMKKAGEAYRPETDRWRRVD